jgi:hypothetical protein
VPFSVPVESVPTGFMENQIARAYLLEVRRSRTFARGSHFSGFENEVPLGFSLVKLYYLKQEYSMNGFSDLSDPEFLNWSQALKMFRCIGILFVSFVISLALSPIGPFSLLT